MSGLLKNMNISAKDIMQTVLLGALMFLFTRGQNASDYALFQKQADEYNMLTPQYVEIHTQITILSETMKTIQRDLQDIKAEQTRIKVSTEGRFTSHDFNRFYNEDFKELKEKVRRFDKIVK